MRLLFDIGHPAHVHLFKNVARLLSESGHDILFTVREKEHVKQLLNTYNLPHKTIGIHQKKLFGKLWGLVRFVFKILLIAKRFKPDILISHGSPYAAIVAAIIRRPHISLEDTGNMEQIRLYKPFTSIIITPESLNLQLGSKQINYPGCHELAYLSPEYFTPDPKILKGTGIDPEEKYVLLRFVSLKATHDGGHREIDNKEKERIVDSLSKYARIFISSEVTLPTVLHKYRVSLDPSFIHDFMYFSSLYFGESATMASESAVLGTPAIYLDRVGRCYTDEQESKFGLVYNYTGDKYSIDSAIDKAIELLEGDAQDQINAKKREDLLNRYIDLSKFLYWIITNHPVKINGILSSEYLLKKFKNPA